MSDHVACEHCGSISETMTATLEEERATFGRELARKDRELTNAKVDKTRGDREVSEKVKRILKHWAVNLRPHKKQPGETSCRDPYSVERVKATSRMANIFSEEELMHSADGYKRRPYCRYGKYHATGRRVEWKADAKDIYKNEGSVLMGLAMWKEDTEREYEQNTGKWSAASKGTVSGPQCRDAYAELKAILEARGLKQGTSWRCPAHDDRSASLSFKRGERGALIECHAGCAKEAVVEAVGWSMSDLFDDPPKEKTEKRIVEVYKYVDEQSKPLYEVVRFEPKGFAQRLPNGEWGLNGTRKVPYRLPSVIKAVQEGRCIFVCEGEADVHALEKAGQVATCNPMGAGKWAHEYSEFFRGAKVAVIADNDDVGIAHAKQVADSLRFRGAEVKVGLPAVGKDVSDHLAAGKSVAEFLPIEEAT